MIYSFQKNGCTFVLLYYLSDVLCSVVYLLANICCSEQRVSGFDQAPTQQALPIVAAGVIPGMMEIS